MSEIGRKGRALQRRGKCRPGRRKREIERVKTTMGIRVFWPTNADWSEGRCKRTADRKCGIGLLSTQQPFVRDGSGELEQDAREGEEGDLCGRGTGAEKAAWWNFLLACDWIA